MALREHDVLGNVQGDQQVIDLQVDGDASYPAGGYPLPTDLLARGIVKVVRVEITPTAGNQRYWWDYDNAKLVFTDGSGTEVANGTDVSARQNIRVRVIGTRR